MTDVFPFIQPSRDPIADAILFVEEAIDALTFECGARVNLRTGEETPMTPLPSTRIFIGPSSPSHG